MKLLIKSFSTSLEVQSRGRRSKKHSKDIGIATFFDNNSSEEELNTLRRNTYESKIELDTLDPPSDATLERKPFNASDFIVCMYQRYCQQRTRARMN